MAKWSLILFVLMLGTLGGVHSAQITVSNQQNLAAAREHVIYIGFDDILPHSVGEEPAKKVFKRDINFDDDFSIDDESSLQNASSEASPLPVGDLLKPTRNLVSVEDSNDNVFSNQDLTAENKQASTGNELDYGKNSNEGQANTTPENLIEVSGEVTEKEESVTIEKTDKSAASEGDAESEDISSENMAVDILPGYGVVNNAALGNLMASDDGSGDGDGEGEETNTSDKMIPVISENSDNEIDETTTSDISIEPDQYITSIKTEKPTAVDISIDESSEGSTDPPDEIPIPNPPTKEDSAEYNFENEGLIRVASPAVSSREDTSAGSSNASGSLAAVDIEGSGEDSDEGENVGTDSEETKENETTTEESQVSHVPAGRNFQPIEAIDTAEPPSPTDAVSEEGGNSGEPPLMKGVLPSANNGEKEGNNEIGVKIEGVSPTKESTDENASSSSGSFILLGAIMVTIVVLLAYTVIKSRRQKKARRSGNITKAAEEDQGREMKEVDKLLAPSTNGFSPPNSGPKDDEKVPLNSFKGDIDELHPIKNGYLPDNDVGGLTDVIVENVPRLSMTPKGNGTAENEIQSEDDQDSWVQSADKALESTKIKMYIDEDSIPKTPIVIVNRGSTPN